MDMVRECCEWSYTVIGVWLLYLQGMNGHSLTSSE